MRVEILQMGRLWDVNDESKITNFSCLKSWQAFCSSGIDMKYLNDFTNDGTDS